MNIKTHRRPVSALAVVGLATIVATSIAAAAQPAKAATTVPPTLTVGSNPIEIAVSNSTQQAYVLNDGSISTLDLASNQVTGTYHSGFHDQSVIGLVQADSQALVGTFDKANLKVYDTTTNRVVGRVNVGAGASGITTVGTGAQERAYVAALTASKVSVLNTATDKVVKQIQLPHGPQTVATTPDESRVWAASSYSGRIWLINPKTQQVVDRFQTDAHGGPAISIAFTKSGQRAWVSCIGGVELMNAKTGKELVFLPAPRIFPRAQNLNVGELALSGNGRYALVLNSTYPDSPAQGSLAVIDTQTLKVTQRIKLGTEPQGLAVAGNTTYVTNYMDDTVSYFPTPR